MKLLKELNPKNKKILVRGDLDVPISNGKITDPFRLDILLKTLKYLLSAKKIYLIGHCGKPEGKIAETLRLKPQAKYLAKKLGLQLAENSCRKFNRRYLLGEKVEILENLRFFPGEEKNSKKFAEKLAHLAQAFVFEAFAVSHRKHASVYWLSRLLPTYLGLRAEKEISVLSQLRKQERQTILLVGGAKAEDKAELIKDFFAKKILLGGKTANELWLKKNKIKQKNLVFPIDGVIENRLINDYKKMTKQEIEKVRDIGPKTIDNYKTIIKKEGKYIIFAGPMGQFEKKKFAQGTKKLYKTALQTGKQTVLLGGDSAYAALKFNLRDRFSYVSIGGGASLNYLISGKNFLGR